MRLVDSDEVSYGRLQMFANNTFYSVCDKSFKDVSASVVCKQLGYKYGRQQCCSALGPIDKTNITISDMKCKGTEQRIEDCKFTFKKGCSTGHYVSVYCTDKPMLLGGNLTTVELL